MIASQIFKKISTVGRKKLEQEILGFFILSQNRPNWGDFLQNYVQKLENIPLKFVTGAGRSFPSIKTKKV
jgi:hypothetical protein